MKILVGKDGPIVNFGANIREDSTIVLKTKKLCQININSLRDKLYFNKKIFKNATLDGKIVFINHDNNYEYCGILVNTDNKEGNKVSYTLGSKPLVPLGIKFNCTIIIEINNILP